MHSASGLNHKTTATEEEAQGDLRHWLTPHQHCLHTHIGCPVLVKPVVIGATSVQLSADPACTLPVTHAVSPCVCLCVWGGGGGEQAARLWGPASHSCLASAHTKRPASSLSREVCLMEYHGEQCKVLLRPSETHQSCRMFLSTYAVQLLSAGGEGTVAASNMSPGTSSTRGNRCG